MWHLARVHARRRGWEGSAAPDSLAGAAGCDAVGAVNRFCGTASPLRDGVPETCSAACAAAFREWYAACPAAAEVPRLAGFAGLCAAAGRGSGHLRFFANHPNVLQPSNFSTPQSKLSKA